MKCKDCKHVFEEKGYWSGFIYFCRRNPPSTSSETLMEEGHLGSKIDTGRIVSKTEWPVVSKNDWCGEFKEKEK